MRHFISLNGTLQIMVCLTHVSDLSTAEEFRQQIPVYGQRRTDLYDTLEK